MFQLQKLVEIIHEVAGAHITAASHAIKINIEETIDDLDFMLQKTTLPRPQVMGKKQIYIHRDLLPPIWNILIG